MAALVERNSEILYLYDARMANPNGDPDEENKPRMDYETGSNLVSDVRLKRYLRDYWTAFPPSRWQELGYPQPQDVWVRKVDTAGDLDTVSAKERIEQLAQAWSGKKAKEAYKDPSFRSRLLETLIDVRLFGATIPMGQDEGSRAGGSGTYTGAVQFSWGYSLNRVELLPSSTITSHFAGRDTGEKGEHGTMGKDWRVRYSLIAFYGVVSAWRARWTRLTERDLRLLDQSMVQALPLMATTRSKLGQAPRLYLRVEYKDGETLLGDPRAHLRLAREEGLSHLAGVHLDFGALLDLYQAHRDRIAAAYVWVHPDLPGGGRLVAVLRELGCPLYDPVRQERLSE